MIWYNFVEKILPLSPQINKVHAQKSTTFGNQNVTHATGGNNIHKTWDQMGTREKTRRKSFESLAQIEENPRSKLFPLLPNCKTQRY